MEERRNADFKDRLGRAGTEARERAEKLPPGQEREALLMKAQRAEVAAQFDDWILHQARKSPIKLTGTAFFVRGHLSLSQTQSD